MIKSNSNDSDNSISIDNNGYNDILFFKVFKNKYIFNNIFRKVREINNTHLINYIEVNHKYLYKEAIKDNDFNSSAIREIKKRRILEYNKIPYEKIFTSGLVEIFKDRLKMKIKFRDDEPIKSILRHFISFVVVHKKEISNDQFIQFYQLNREYLDAYQQEDYKEQTEDIFQLLVERREYEKLLKVYELEKKSIEDEKNLYYKIKKEREEELTKFYNEYGYNVDIVLDKSSGSGNSNSNGNNSEPPFKIFFNHSLVKVALQSSSLEIVKFLNETLELDFSHYDSNLYLWAIEGDQRNQIINYLMDKDFKVPKSFNTSNHQNYFQKILLLDYPTYKRMVLGKEAPLLYRDDFYAFADKIQDYSYSSIKDFKSQLSFIQNAVHSNYIHTGSIKSLIIIKLINKLIKFNNNNNNNISNSNSNNNSNNNSSSNNNSNNNNSNSNSNSNINSNSSNSSNSSNIDYRITSRTIQKIQNKYKDKLEQPDIKYNNNNNSSNTKSIFSKLSNYIFQSSSSSNNSNNVNNNSSNINNDNSNNDKLSKSISINDDIFKCYLNIDYQEFNLEKEVKRLYLFHFLKNNLSEISYFRCLVFYSCKFKEYNLVKEYYDTNRPSDSYGSLTLNIKSSSLTKYLYEAIGLYNDIEFYIFCKENDLLDISVPKELRTSDFRISRKPDIGKCIKLLEVFKNNNDPYFKELLLSILNTEKLEFSTIGQLMDILVKYYKDNNTQHDAYIIPNYIYIDSTFFYLYNNYNHLFLDWDKSYKIINYQRLLLIDQTK